MKSREEPFGSSLLCFLCRMLFFLCAMRHRRADEPRKERVRTRRAGFEFRVRLRSDEPRVVAQLHHFHDVLVRGDAADVHPRVLQRLAVVVVDLITMAVPFVDELLLICRIRF